MLSRERFERFARFDRYKSLDLPALLALERNSPRDVDLLLQIGSCYFMNGQLKECFIYRQRALAIDPNDGWTHLYFGNFCEGLRCYEQAVEHFTRAAELLPNVACPYWCLGDVYAAQGYLARTEAQYRRAVAVDPNDAVAKQKLERWLSGQDRDLTSG